MRHAGENLDRREWLVERIPHLEARRVIECWHYSHSVPNTGTTHGLLARASYPLSEVQGAALWLPPTKTAAVAVAGDQWHGVLALSRLVVDPELPRNAASFLLARSMRLLDRERWPVLLTYADTRHGHTGAIYLATGWVYDGDSSGGDYYVHAETGEQVGRKRGRRNLRRADLEAAGYVHHRSLKRRYVHRST